MLSSRQYSNTSRQNQKCHGETKKLTAKPKTHGETKKLTAKPKSFSFDKSFFNNWSVTRGVMCVIWKVSAFLKCVLTSRIGFSWNLVPLYIIVFKNTISVSDISAVNLIVGRCKFASSMKVSMCLGREALQKPSNKFLRNYV